MKGFLGAIGALFLNRPADNDVEDEDEQARPPEGRGTLLVIDDEVALLDTLRPLLREAGFTVLSAQSGAKGLDLLRYAQKDIRAVVLDYNMPRLSGFETLQYVRKIAPGIKVIALSGVNPELLPEEFRVSADRFMAKPFRSVELIRAIEDLITPSLPQSAA